MFCAPNEVSIYRLLIKLRAFSIKGKEYLLVFFLLVFPVPLSHQLFFVVGSSQHFSVLNVGKD